MITTFKYKLMNNWNVIRFIRLALSIIIIAQAFQTQDMLFGIFGSFFLYQALTNTGCCGANSCAPNTNKPITATEEVQFTELKK